MSDCQPVKKGLYAYPLVGRTGLCNMLFPWARAFVFARKHKCSIIAPQWTTFNRIGPWLRRERDKRYYTGQFTNDGYVKGLHRWVALMSNITRRITENDWNLGEIDSGIVVFRGLGNYFNDFAEDAEIVKQELLKIVSPNILLALDRLPTRFIGVHIRAGDFVSTGQNMPLDYYMRGIEAARELVKETMPVLVFSDAKQGQLDSLTQAADVKIMPPAPAIHDVLALSRSSALVGTNHSSFSEWAVFLGGMKSIWSRDGRPPCKLFDGILV